MSLLLQEKLSSAKEDELKQLTEELRQQLVLALEDAKRWVADNKGAKHKDSALYLALGAVSDFVLVSSHQLPGCAELAG